MGLVQIIVLHDNTVPQKVWGRNKSIWIFVLFRTEYMWLFYYCFDLIGLVKYFNKTPINF